MTNIVHMCIDPLRVFADAAYDPAPEKKPRSGPGKGNEHTEAAITEIIGMTQIFEEHGIPTYWYYMDNFDNPYDVDESGGGLHPRIMDAFPDYRDNSRPKWSQSAFRHYSNTKQIEQEEPKLIVFSGYLTSECVKDSACDMDVFYKDRSLSHVHRFIARETTSDSDDQKLVKGALDSMERSGVEIGSVKQVPSLIKQYLG